MSEDVVVRRLAPEEGLLAAALHVQSLRAAGRSAPAGHFDRFADVWSRGWAHLPTWVAECDGEHAGVLMVQLPAPLPAEVGPAPRPRVVLLYAVSTGPAERATHALLATASRWAREGDGPADLELAEDVAVPASVLDALGARVEQVRRVRVPAR